MMPSKEEPHWIVTVATVTTCTYQFARMNTLFMGLQTGKKFRITFDYYAHGRLFSGEFQSARAVPQNERIPLRYNPLRPEQNDRSSQGGIPSGSLMAAGVFGSVFLSLLWFALYWGCS